jgi:hypothetical protein
MAPVLSFRRDLEPGQLRKLGSLGSGLMLRSCPLTISGVQRVVNDPLYLQQFLKISRFSEVSEQKAANQGGEAEVDTLTPTQLASAIVSECYG